MSDVERTLQELEKKTAEELANMKTSHVAQALDGSIGRLTHIDAHQQHQIALHGQRRLEFQLQYVRLALSRLKDGTYGTCLQCGLAMTPARLEDAPETPFCISCQEKREREGRA